MDSIVDCFLTRFTEFSIKNYIYPEISSKMENQLREYVSFVGVASNFIKIFLKILKNFKNLEKKLKFKKKFKNLDRFKNREKIKKIV